jgi:hypothetical protein
VSIETVVRHDPPQIRVSDEENTEQVVDLALVPVGTIVEIAQTGHRGRLVRVRLDPQARVVADAEHVVDDLEALVLGGVVDSGDVGNLGVFGRGVVLEEGKGGDNARRRDVDGQLVLPYGEPANPSATASLGPVTTHCWTYFGRHDMRYCPYLCSDSPFSLYASAGFTIALLSLMVSSRGANCVSC